MDKTCSVLMYHAVYRTEAERKALAPEDRPYALSLEEFRYHLEIIAGAGIPVIPASGLAEKKPLPERSVVMTFDDGYADVSTVIAPELRTHNLTGTVFVSAGTMGTPGFLTGEQVRNLAAGGMGIGSHGYSHRLFSSMTEPEGRDELKRSKKILEEATGRQIVLLSLPGGGISCWLPDAAHAAGFRLVFGSRPGYFMGGSGVVPRIPVRPGMARADLLNIVRGEGATVKRMRWGYRVRSALRTLLGEAVYFRLYKLVTRGRQ